MATAVIMPKQGQSVETCIITRWFKNKGESVSVGDILFSYETDKASFDLESPVEGILLDVYFGDGTEVPVLINVAVIGKSGETTEFFNPGHTKASTASKTFIASTSPEALEVLKTEKEVETQPEYEAKIRISPRAKRMAENKGLDYNNLRGSGPNGRIIARDVEKVHSGETSVIKNIQTQGTEYTEQPLSNVRKLIAKAMQYSLQNSAQLTHHMGADVRFLLEARQKIKDKLSTDKSQQDITLNDMICWCV